MSSDARSGANADDLAPPLPPGLVRLKERLQFSGWLQFVLPFVLCLGALVLAGLGALVGLAGFAKTVCWIALALALYGVLQVAQLKLRLFSLPDRDPRPVTGSIFDVMRARHACRSFQPGQLTDEHLKKLKTLIRRHTKPDNADALVQGLVRAEYVAQPLTVWPAHGAQEFVVVLGPATYDRAAVIEAGRAMTQVVNGLTAQGIATCWIGPGANQASVEHALEGRFEPATDHVLCVIAVGYESRYKPLLVRLMSAVMHRRKPVYDLVFEDVPGVPAPMRRAPFKALGPIVDACRWAPSSYNSQTTRLILTMANRKLRRVRFCTAGPSRYYAPLALGIWAGHWEAGASALNMPGRFSLREQALPMALDLYHHLDWVALEVDAPRR